MTKQQFLFWNPKHSQVPTLEYTWGDLTIFQSFSKILQRYQRAPETRLDSHRHSYSIRWAGQPIAAHFPSLFAPVRNREKEMIQVSLILIFHFFEHIIPTTHSNQDVYSL